MSYSLERVLQVWDDRHGNCIEVGNDSDALDLVEVRYRDEAGKIIDRIVMKPEQALLVCEALRQYIEALPKKT